MVEENTSAMLARWLINKRLQPQAPEVAPEVPCEVAHGVAREAAGGDPRAGHPESASDNFLADRVPPPSDPNGRR